jgi:hypothetical protein
MPILVYMMMMIDQILHTHFSSLFLFSTLYYYRHRNSPLNFLREKLRLNFIFYSSDRTTTFYLSSALHRSLRAVKLAIYLIFMERRLHPVVLPRDIA